MLLSMAVFSNNERSRGSRLIRGLDYRDVSAARPPCPVNYYARNQRSGALKESAESRDSDKKSCRYYEGGDTVSSDRALLLALAAPSRRSFSRAFALPARD